MKGKPYGTIYDILFYLLYFLLHILDSAREYHTVGYFLNGHINRNISHSGTVSLVNPLNCSLVSLCFFNILKHNFPLQTRCLLCLSEIIYKIHR